MNVNPNPRIDLMMPVLDAVVRMCDGNPGAVEALCHVMEAKGEFWIVQICYLDDAKIYGSDIWVGYKHVCNKDIDLFIKLNSEGELKQKIEDFKK